MKIKPGDTIVRQANQMKPWDIVGDAVRTARVRDLSHIYCGGRARTILALDGSEVLEDSVWVVWTAWLTDGVWELRDRQEFSWRESELAYTAFWHRAGWALNG